MKSSIERNLQILDLILVSLFGLFVWRARLIESAPLFFLVALRLLVSFSLIEHKRVGWLPIAIFDGLVLYNLFFYYRIDSSFPMSISFDMIKAMSLFLGDAQWEHLFSWKMLAENGMSFSRVVGLSFTFIYWGWMLLYPVGTLWHQKRQKVATSVPFWKSSVVFVVSYLVITFIVSLFLAVAFEDTNRIFFYLWLLFLLVLPLYWTFRRKRKLPVSVVRYLLFASIFITTFMAGRETERYLSLFVLWASLAVFYYSFCTVKRIPMVVRDWLVLTVGGFLFWLSLGMYGFFRVALLVFSLLLMGYQVWIVYKRSSLFGSSLLLFLSLAFLLPVLAVGYNPFTVIHAGVVTKFEGFSNSPNGVLLISDGEHYGLRDRYVEILPCRYEKVKESGIADAPYACIKQDGLWGLYNLREHEVAESPSYKSIYPYDDNYYRMITSEGHVCFYQLSRPSPEFIADRICPFIPDLDCEHTDNGPQLEAILKYIMTSSARLFEEYASPQEYLEWNRKAADMIHRIAQEYCIFSSDTISEAEQAILRIKTLLDKNSGNTQAEMNGCSYGRANLAFFQTVTKNRMLIESFNRVPAICEILEAEYRGWMHYYRCYYDFYAECVMDGEHYSALPMDLNAINQMNAEDREKWIQMESDLFLKNQPINYQGEVFRLEELDSFIERMNYKQEHIVKAEYLQEAIHNWLDGREYYLDVLSDVCSETMIESYRNSTKKLVAYLYHDLESLCKEYKDQESIWILRREIAEEEETKALEE